MSDEQTEAIDKTPAEQPTPQPETAPTDAAPPTVEGAAPPAGIEGGPALSDHVVCDEERAGYIWADASAITNDLLILTPSYKHDANFRLAATHFQEFQRYFADWLKGFAVNEADLSVADSDLPGGAPQPMTARSITVRQVNDDTTMGPEVAIPINRILSVSRSSEGDTRGGADPAFAHAVIQYKGDDNAIKQVRTLETQTEIEAKIKKAAE